MGQNTLLVTGASGQLGRRVVELLLEANAGQIIATTRTPEKLADFSARGVIVRKADFDDPASLVEAFKGADRLLLISTDVLDVPGRRLKQHVNAVKAAEQVGVKHIVYTSLINPSADSPVLIAGDHRGTEEALAASKLDWTVLRESVYTDMLPQVVGQAIQTGQLMTAAGQGKIAYITREDCAYAAAGALTDNFNGRRTLDITGPSAISHADLAAIASQITGRTIAYIPLEPAVLVQGMVGAGLPQPIAELLVSFDTAIAQGRFDVVTNAVQQLSGHAPTSVADFLAAHLTPVTS